jgi:6-phosphogluconolactonase (cycloisomerase 2 family)/tetratricopeptide (TPR) repeat protein
MWCRSLRVVLLIVAFTALCTRAAWAGTILEFVGARFDGVGGVTGLDRPESIAVSPDGRHVYVASSYDDAVAVFRREGSTGALTFVEAVFDNVGGIDGLNGAVSVAVSPDGAHVYVASQYDGGAVAVFRRDAVTGALTFVEAKLDGRGGIDGLGGADAVAVSADGAHVYVAGRYDNAVAVFARNPGTGALTFVEATVNGAGGVEGLAYVGSVTVSPDGKHVYATGSGDAVSFARDSGTGRLTFLETDDIFGSAAWVTVSPDGRNVYVAASFDIYVYARDATSGALTLVEEEAVSSIDGAESPDMVAVSPNGEYVYAATSADDALAVFQRSATTGELTFTEAHIDGIGGVDGLNGARSVAVSPDGAHVYVTGADDDAVATFWKDFPSELADGNEAYFAQNWATAEQLYTTLLAQDPNSAIAFNNRGLARCKQLDFAGAQADFDVAKSHDPTWVAPYVNQGKCLAMQGSFAAAQAELEAGLTLDPNHVKLLYNLGWVEAEQGSYEEALERYDAALAQDPTYVRAIVASGVAQAEKGDGGFAVTTFYKAINTAPTGDLFAAIAAYDLQLLRGPGASFDNATAAQAYLDGLFDMRAGSFEQAAAHLTDAENLAPAVPDIPWLLAWCRLRQLQSAAAATAFAAARALMPVLEIDSADPAQLFVDGMFRGNTPQTLGVFASRFDLAFRRADGPQERTVVAYADGTAGGASPIDVTLSGVSKYSLFAPEIDSDRDWLGDAWELAAFGDLREGPAGDSDHDGVTNLLEYWAKTDPGPGSEAPGTPRIRRHLRAKKP